MNLNVIKSFVALCFITLAIIVSTETQAQTIIKIGEAELVIQSPITVKRDSLTIEQTPMQQGQRTKFRARFSSNIYVGGSMAIPMERNDYLSVHYGEVYNIEAGVKNIYRVSPLYGIGTMVGYSFYNYRLMDKPFDGIFNVTATDIKKEYFRTNNISVGLFNRFYLTRRPFVRIDAGAYGDFVVNGKYKVRGSVGGSNIKEKFRDGSVFNPLQAGLYGAVVVGDWSIFGKYRLTNQFNPGKSVKETPRLNIGVLWSL